MPSLGRLPVAAAASLAAALALGCGGGGGGGGGPEAPFGLDVRVPVSTLTFPTSAPAPGTIAATEAFPSLASFALPVFVTAPPGDTGRLFVLEKAGRIRVFSNTPGVSSSTVFLDLLDRVSSGGEQGLLGLAFHPDYAANKTFYVSYVAATPRRSVISRFKVTGADPDVADKTTETILFTLVQPAAYDNHKGGMIAFGPDGYLYAGFGDGGSGGDPDNRALDLTDPLGKMLRVGVGVNDPANTWTIPPTNPFATGTGPEVKEIFAWGLRNPWRWSFDRLTGRLWCGDVGQGTREEIDVVEKGKNYGWRAREGFVTTPYGDGGISSGPYVDPVFDYPRSVGTCVIGGYAYRGTAAPSLAGAYLYADHEDGRIWALTYDGAQVTSNTHVASASSPSSFGEDASGEVYVCELFSGRIKKIVETGGGGGDPFPETLSATGIYANLQTLAPSPGLVPYDVNVPLWSDDALKDRLLALPGSERIGWSRDGAWGFPLGTCLVKTFRLPTTVGVPETAVRVETRVLLLGPSGWEGYVYRWRDDQTDADLLAGPDTRTLSITDPAAPGGTRVQTWTFPSRSDCLRCHTQAAGRVLGLSTRQINRDHDYGAVTDNQLRAWEHVGLFDGAVPAPADLPAHPAPSDPAAPVAARARAYLDANCSMCHRPGGPSQASIDLRSTVPVGAMGVVGVRPGYGNLGLIDPWIVDSGDATNSVLWLRMTATDASRMPPLATSVVDAQGSALVRAWIDAGP